MDVLTPYQALLATAERCGPALAVVDADGGPSLTYAELASRATRLASWVLRHAPDGAGAGAVGVLSPNCPDVIVAHLAASAAGAVVVNISPLLVARELAHVLSDSGSWCVLAWHEDVPRLFEAVAAAGAACAVLVVVVLGGGSTPDLLSDTGVQLAHVDSLLNADDDTTLESVAFPSPDLGQSLEMYYTSGTTGQPKAVILSTDNVSTHALGCIAEMRLCGSDCWLHLAPMYHLVDAFAIYAITFLGGRHVVMRRFSPRRALEVIETEVVTVTNVATPMIQLILTNDYLLAADLSSLRVVSCGGSPAAPATARRVVAQFGCEFFQNP